MLKKLAMLAVVLSVAVGAPVDVWVSVGPVSPGRSASALSVFSASMLLMAAALWRRRRAASLPGSGGAG